MTQKIKLSVVSITYNQESFIKDAIEGFLKQKVNFTWEIIIADDASSDNTQKIIKEYTDKHPHLIKPILRPKNVGVLDNLYDALRSAKGKYIAICEGDDFWTDENKLQKQVDFLEKHTDYSLCFHPVKVVYENKEKADSIYPDPKKSIRFDVYELLKNNFIQTNSVMYRKQDYATLPKNIMPIDWYLHLYHAQFGKIGFINRTMSVYRRHPGGIWWEARQNIDKFWMKHGFTHMQFFIEVLKMHGSEKQRRKIIENTAGRTIGEFIEKSDKEKNKIIKDIQNNFPDFIEPTFRHLIEKIEDKDFQIEKLNQKIEEKQAAIERRNKELEAVKSTRVWKTRSALRKLRKK